MPSELGIPAEFRAALDNLVLWGRARLSPRLMGSIVRVWEDPKGREGMARLCKLLVETAKERVERIDQVNSPELVAMVTEHLAVQSGLKTFLPPPYSELLPDRELTFFSFVTYFGLLSTGGSSEVHDQLFRSTLRAICSLIGGPIIELEFERRAAKHVGYHAAMLLVLMQIRRQVGTADPSWEQAEAECVEAIRKSARRMTPDVMRPELPGQIALTLDTRWGKLGDRELITRALEGKLDIAPRAIRDALVKQGAAESHTRKIEVLFDRSEEPQEGEEGITGWEDILRSPDWGPEEETRWKEILSALRTNLPTRRLLQAALEGAETQAEIADRWGVDPRTVRNWLAGLKDMLDK